MSNHENLSQFHLGSLVDLIRLARHVKTNSRGYFSTTEDAADCEVGDVLVDSKAWGYAGREDFLCDGLEPFCDWVELSTLDPDERWVKVLIVNSTESGALALLTEVVHLINNT